MKRDTDIISDLMQWLFDQPQPGKQNLSGDVSFPLNVSSQSASPHEGPHGDGRAPDQPMNFVEGGMSDYDIEDLEAFEVSQRSGMNLISDSGDIPAVQNHFESLLKRRLRQEIEQHPPMFPWETAVDDYPDVVISDRVPTSIWLDHLKDLDVPAVLPDEVLSCLLARCQELSQQTLRSGVRLIKAVEDLFPDQPTSLEQVAKMVMMPAYRSVQATPLATLDYQTATEPQQAALAMMAARAIFESLEINVSSQQPEVQREWLTEAGPMTLTVVYDGQMAEVLTVQADLPMGGTVYLGGEAQSVAAERPSAGTVSLALAKPQVGQGYPLSVQLGDANGTALQFWVSVNPT